MAAFDFPNSPSVNDQYTANGVTFKWNGTIWQRISASSGAQGTTGSTGPTGAQGAAAGLTISTSAPGSPSAGDMWWDSDAGLFLTYYNDGNSSQWVEINQGPKGAQGATGPTGAQGATGPTGAQGATGSQGAAGSNASISSNADNRVITGGSGTNLVAEANLTFTGNNLGIGSAIPAQLLDIASTAPNIRFTDTVYGHAEIDGNSADLKFNADKGNAKADSQITFFVDNDEKVRITSDGKMGLGTSSVDELLHVANTGGGASILIETNASSGGNILFGDNSSNTVGRVQYVHSDNSMRFNTDGAERLRITSAGNIGINEDAPSEKLQIDGDILLGGQANSSESNYAIKFEYNNHQFAKIVGDGRDSSGYGDIDFYTSTGSGVSNLTQRMSIRADGKIGINQTSPQRILHVGESGTAEANIRIQGGSDYGEIRVKDSDNNLSFHHNVGGAGSRELFNSNGSTGHFSINCYSYQALTITTNENGTNGPELSLVHNSASPAASDSIAQIRFNAKDSAGNTDLYARIHANLASPTSGSESGDLVFATRGSGTFAERLRITGNGLSFNGDTAAANALDDYEEGSWTPGNISATMVGKYTKIGNTVFWQCTINSISGSGTFRVSGLPYTVNNSWGGGISISNYNQSYPIMVFAHSGSTDIYFRNTNNVSYNTVSFSGKFFYIHGFYYTS